MNGDWYDTAQICLNGHLINARVRSSPEHSRNRCPDCGEPTITECKSCNAIIHGFYHMAGVAYWDAPKVPSYCHNCGTPYPWTVSKREAALELFLADSHATGEEAEQFTADVDELLKNTPKAPVANSRFKQFLARVPGETAAAIRAILYEIASEAAKRQFFQNP